MRGSFPVQASQNEKGDQKRRASENTTELDSRCPTRGRREEREELRTELAMTGRPPLMEGMARYFSCLDEGGNGGRRRAAPSSILTRHGSFVYGDLRQTS